MANLEKLIEILHTDKEIKEELTELKFGCKIKNKHTGGIVYLLQSGDDGVLVYNGVANHILYDRNIEIIGVEPEIRHILQYCNNKMEHMAILGNGYLVKVFSNSSLVNTLIRINPYKSLKEQSQKTIDSLVEYLSNIKA